MVIFFPRSVLQIEFILVSLPNISMEHFYSVLINVWHIRAMLNKNNKINYNFSKATDTNGWTYFEIYSENVVQTIWCTFKFMHLEFTCIFHRKITQLIHSWSKTKPMTAKKSTHNSVKQKTVYTYTMCEKYCYQQMLSAQCKKCFNPNCLYGIHIHILNSENAHWTRRDTMDKSAVDNFNAFPFEFYFESNPIWIPDLI